MATDTDIRYLKGVGERRAALYRRLGVETLGDLLRLFPRDYIDLSAPRAIADAAIGERCALRAAVTAKGGEVRLRGGLSLWKVQATDGVSDITLTFFNTRYAVAALKEGESYLFYGTVAGTLLEREMASPTVFSLRDGGGLWPVYPLTAGLTGRSVAAHVRTALSLVGDGLPDPLPPAIRARNRLAGAACAARAIHAPADEAEVALARRRWAFEELFLLSLALKSVRRGRSARSAAAIPAPDWADFLAALPFSLTVAQRRAIADIAADLGAGRLMNRLLQGDVGSGKTAVAAAAAYMICRAGRQAALMAPTEILAAQHFGSLAPLAERAGIRHALLTGGTPAAEKRRVKAALAAGDIDLIIGTHALLTGDVHFNNLALVITDEQHRFGVNQRTALTRKGDAHTLVMSATPIPRTLSLILYGDLDVSVLDELPAGRRPVDTYRIGGDKRARAFAYIKKHLDRGLQGYIICPLVEENPDLPALTSAVEYAEQIARGAFEGYRVGMLHGKMRPKEKTGVMNRFHAGDIQLLVATTVVEVGVDVPNAVIMLVEGAERFGLSQLHQLRGRVGRGGEASTCILLTDSASQTALRRLDLLCRSQNGFEIAEADLELRGPGDFFGERQHGLPPLRVADLGADAGLLEAAEAEAARLLGEDPALEKPEHRLLRGAVAALFDKIGASPN